MTFLSLAIIGTAGRKQDKHLLSRFHYDRMIKASIEWIDHLQLDRDRLKLYSGGAAWADHLVVTLASRGVVKCENVTLFLPTILDSDGFVGHNNHATKTASTANYYHHEFSKVTGLDSIGDLHSLSHRGGTLIPGTGNFFSRNSDVAKAISPDGLLLAYTFGAPGIIQQPWSLRPFASTVTADQAGLRDGGTADTWNKSHCVKWHGLLGPTDEIPDLI